MGNLKITFIVEFYPYYSQKRTLEFILLSGKLIELKMKPCKI